MNRKDRKQRIRERQLQQETVKGRLGETGKQQTAEYAEDAEDSNSKSQFERDTQRCARAMNRMRQHRELCKREGLKIRPAGLRNVRGKIAPSQMVWRRISSMTIPLEPFMDAAERRSGLERLMKWLERTARRGSPSPCGRGLGGGVDTDEPGGAHPSPYPLPQGERENNGNREDRLVHADWAGELGSWQRVKCDGFSVEAVCAQLGITRWKLTQLTKEYCNLTATELFDGWKVRQLKTFMLARLRDAAQQLWKYPGDYAQYKAQGYLDCQTQLSSNTSLLKANPKQSKFFPSTPRDLFTEEKWAEKERRTTALIEKMWEEFDFESWALSAGYSSVRRLKRAIMNVLGKTFERLERCLAGEIIEYYQCAEARELRNIALREDDCDAILDARRLYHKSEERPSEPFLDMWSAYEFAAKAWLDQMAGAFG